MKQIKKINLYFLDIPFQMKFTHASASKDSCKNLIIEVASEEYTGFGEAIIRDIPDSSKDNVITLLREIIKKINSLDINGAGELKNCLTRDNFSKEEIPLLCGIETAILDYLCKKRKTNLFSILDRKPKTDIIQYNGTIPIADEKTVIKLLTGYIQLGINTIRIKVSDNTDYNYKSIELIKNNSPKTVSFFVDANSSWGHQIFKKHIPILTNNNISLLEEPFKENIKNIEEMSSLAKQNNIKLMADQSVVDLQDLNKIIHSNTYDVINIRIGKVGGLFRSISMIEKIKQAGLKFYLGCRVGETGILSKCDQFLGFLSPDYAGADHPFDFYLLKENIINQDTKFNSKGGITLRNNDFCSYTINNEILRKYTQDKIRVL